MKKPLKLYCEKCDTIFANSKNVRAHYRAKHPGEIPQVLEDAEETKEKKVDICICYNYQADMIFSVANSLSVKVTLG